MRFSSSRRRCVASPVSRCSSENVGVASRCPCPTTSWMMSGSGVYSGLAGWRTYCVEWKTRSDSEP